MRRNLIKFFLLYTFFFILILLSFPLFASQEDIESFIKTLDYLELEKDGWVRVWENPQSIVFVHSEYVKKTEKGFIFLAKISPGKEKAEEIRKSFGRKRQELEKEGYNVGPYWEEIVKDAIKSNSYYQLFMANCEKKELLVVPFKGVDKKDNKIFNISSIFKVELSPGGYGEALFNHFCKSK